MKDLHSESTKLNSLRHAWYRIRSNGIRSPLQETRYAIESFDRNAEQRLSRIQRYIREGKFIFEHQKGVLKEKSSGSKRGIVMASVQNRVVERTLLNSLQTHVPFVMGVITTPTSVGGVPDRSVPHGLALIRDALNDGNHYFIRSDITGFFDNIPRHDVLRILEEHISDKKFLKLLDDATTVTLANEIALGEDRSLFPTYEDGVAQGSPLSPLFGNILLHKFDTKFNGRGIICIRFIDDFIILGKNPDHVKKAFNNAKAYLSDLGLKCHDPFDKNTSRKKAQMGHVETGFIFLGYEIQPNLFQPSEDARKSLIEKIDKNINYGRKAIIDVLRTENSFEHRQRYVQTLDLLDRVTRGWGDAFAYSNRPEIFDNLDKEINKKIDNFRSWYQRKIKNIGWRNKRRTGGVCLLSDIQQKSLDSLPFRLVGEKKRRVTKDIIFISTDGSVIGTGPRKGRDKGPGGWAAVFHNDGKEISGNAKQVTNNQMELTAVIEALKYTPVGSRVRIRTDSQYISRAVHEGTLISSNIDLWNEYASLSSQRRIDVVWIQGHSGDPHNERADRLANEQARLLSKHNKVSL